MPESPLISVITPSYNQGRFIEATIQSVLNQSYKNIQYILIDGGSTDHTMDIVNKYRHKIEIIIHEKDKGQSDAINKGFKLAQGKLVGWINSDDILYENCVSEIVKLYHKSSEGTIFYGSKIDYINAAGIKFEQKNICINSIKDLLFTNYDVVQQGSFYNSHAVQQVNYLNNDLHFCMDLDLWLKLLKLGSIHYYSEEPIAAFRIWEGAKTTTSSEYFLKDIRNTLSHHGSSSFSKNISRLTWYQLKTRIKGLLKKV